MADEAIMDRIAKLLAKANGTNNEHEAAIFAAKAAEMLAEHNLTEAMLRSRDSDREQGPIGSHAFTARCPDRWRELILQGCAKLYFCKLTFRTVGSKKTYTLHGREHNATVAKLMTEYLFATVKRMAREYSPAKAEQGDFRRGAGLRLYERLVELYEVQNKPAPAGAPGSGLPALYAGEFQAVEAYMATALGKLRPAAKGRGMKLGLGAAHGRDAADRISLNKQVAETRQSRLLK